MSRVRSIGTAPELCLRRSLWALGLRYRLHAKDLPGTPDIVFRGARLAVFVHGCFWHAHDCKHGARRPKTNTDYWDEKRRKNRARDLKVLADLKDRGWTPLVAWACENQFVVAAHIESVLREAAGRASE